MCRNHRFRNFARFAALAASVAGFAATSAMPSAWAQDPQAQVQGVPYPPGQYPPGQRPQPVAVQCQSTLTDRISADAGRRVSLNLDTQNSYSVGNGRQGLRGRLRYGIGPPATWRTGTYDCIVNLRQNRVERATYTPRANSGGWPGGPGIPGGPGFPGGPGGPGVGNYPRVRVDTSGRGSFNTRSFANVRITRGWVDSTGRPSVSLSGSGFKVTFYGVVERTDGNREFTMRITGSDRGNAQGSAQVRLNRDRNEVEIINLNGRMGRDNFSGNFGR